MNEYLNPRSQQTLRQGVLELRAAEGADGDAAENVAADLVHDIDVHDAIHVLFGCSTDLSGEIVAHVWTLFGTTMELRDMRRVNMHEDHRAVLARIGHRRLLGTWWRSASGIAATVARALRMKRRWPAQDYVEYLDMRLCDIRAQFGITLPEPTPGRRQSGPAGAALRNVRSNVRGSDALT